MIVRTLFQSEPAEGRHAPLGPAGDSESVRDRGYHV